MEVALHEHKALEGELERSRAEAEDQVENYFEDDDHDDNYNGNDDNYGDKYDHYDGITAL